MSWLINLWMLLTGSRQKAMLLEGRRLLNARRFSASLEVYRHLINEWPELVEGYEGLAALFQEMGLTEEARKQQAIVTALQTLRKKADDAESHLRLAREFYDTGHYKASLPHAEAALRQTPRRPDVVRLTAVVLRYNNLFKRAMEVLNQALVHEPLAPDLYEQQTFNLRAMGKQLEAAKVGNLAKALRSVENNPGDPEELQKAIYQLAVVGRRAQALPLVDRALEATPEIPGLFTLRGELLLEDGRPQEALENLRQAVELDATDIKGQNLLAKAYSQVGNSEQAIWHGQLAKQLEGAKAHPEHIETELGMVGVLLKSGQVKRALARAEKLLPIYGDDWRCHYIMGLVRHAQGKRAEAMESLRKAVHMNDRSPEIFFAMARLQVEAGRMEDGLSQGRHAVSLAPRQMWVREEMASLLESMGLMDLAREERQLGEAIARRQSISD
jgi:tetratricopeptide (TPR) repeat protein